MIGEIGVAIGGVRNVIDGDGYVIGRVGYVIGGVGDVIDGGGAVLVCSRKCDSWC